ncbi:coenzyme F420-reducing hydrogenase, alpha subunit [Beggiatoa alba B18LD]|uniref:Coenzyme F420-reducing hydrogenase, alpha subunit n=1 Tax=Beggiatoa alba B18LD TaxID=395493 RepID=I3CK80_9GAMM|nr:Ni/Fe hydrogenase subunit alpha [Beggiatoa alba]EIJ44023.1 coenzyme F420-reducing hydrogenase, alpha subunit [Beggiatoa alba B18LD]
MSDSTFSAVSTSQRSLTITVPALTRVEGEGGLDLVVKDGKITDLKLRIFEPPRYFEKFLEGRTFEQVLDIVARICGICPVAYQMSAVHAIESIFQVNISPWAREMRRLLYCGEWLESHNLHIHLLALPDFLGFKSALEMAGQYGEPLKRGLRLQHIGNDIIRLLGGRSVHPVGVRVGGFYHAPTVAQMSALKQKILEALPDAEALVRWTASLALPDYHQSFTTVCNRHAQEYPFNEGRLVSSDGLDIAIADYEQYFTELHVPHSTALHSTLRNAQGNEQSYLVGPLARVNLNYAQLPAAVRFNVEQTAVRFPSQNVFHSIVARAVEVHFALLEALRILENYQVPERPYVDITPRAGVGYGCTEAPRGMLWQRWELNERGEVISCKIVPPTSQNQMRIEEDLRDSLEEMGLQHSDEALRLRAEMIVRNYDPCISCATHFLKLNITRHAS